MCLPSTPSWKKCTPLLKKAFTCRDGTRCTVSFHPFPTSSPHQSPPADASPVAFAGATVLIVATLSPNLNVDFDVEPTKSSWERALQIIDYNKTHVASAEKGVEVLQRFRQHIARRLAERRSSKSSPIGTPATGHPLCC